MSCANAKCCSINIVLVNTSFNIVFVNIILETDRWRFSVSLLVISCIYTETVLPILSSAFGCCLNHFNFSYTIFCISPRSMPTRVALAKRCSDWRKWLKWFLAGKWLDNVVDGLCIVEVELEPCLICLNVFEPDEKCFTLVSPNFGLLVATVVLASVVVVVVVVVTVPCGYKCASPSSTIAVHLSSKSFHLHSFKLNFWLIKTVANFKLLTHK